AVGLHAQQIDVSGGAEQALLQVLAESVVNGERDDERGHAGSDAQDRNNGDDANDRLPSFCAQITRSDEEFEAQVWWRQSGQRNYKRAESAPRLARGSGA